MSCDLYGWLVRLSRVLFSEGKGQATHVIGLRNSGEEIHIFEVIQMRWDGEYRGVGIAIPVGEQVAGVEQGEFFKEGNAVVSSISLSGVNTWTTSECGDKNGLIGAEAVSNPGIPGTNLKPTLIFDRVVIGAP